MRVCGEAATRQNLVLVGTVADQVAEVMDQSRMAGHELSTLLHREAGASYEPCHALVEGLYYHAAQQGDADLAQSYAIGGALSLYINFINLFLALLRIFSARN